MKRLRNDSERTNKNCAVFCLLGSKNTPGLTTCQDMPNPSAWCSMHRRYGAPSAKVTLRKHSQVYNHGGNKPANQWIVTSNWVKVSHSAKKDSQVTKMSSQQANIFLQPFTTLVSARDTFAQRNAEKLIVPKVFGMAQQLRSGLNIFSQKVLTFFGKQELYTRLTVVFWTDDVLHQMGP